MDLVVFEQNKPMVLQSLTNGEFDYMEAANEVFETEFFKHIGAKKILEQAAQTYPTPRKKEEVPLWFYIASELTMRLHGAHSFNSYPMVVRTGGMLNAFFPKNAQPVAHPDSQDMTLACDGFNKKNDYDRETPCDQDFLRKLSKGTDAKALMQWFNRDIAKILRSQRAFDKDGIFIGDASYLFVPDNPKYEGSKRLLFDESNHPVSQKDFQKMSDERKVRCQWKRCYKMVTLMHTNAKLEYFLLVGVKVVSGEEHECPLLYQLVKEFVEAVGMDVVKELILDRGFLDGENISRNKREYGIDTLIPVRKNMDVYTDAMLLFDRPDVKWVACEDKQEEKETIMPMRLKPIAIRKREQKRQETLEKRKQEQPPPPSDTIIVKKEAAAIGEFTSWDTCTVPLTVIANREHYGDGHEETWLLLSTKQIHDPATAGRRYHLRTAIEERYRQLKCFSDLASFTSRSLSLVVNQIIFTLFAYNLLQLYMLRIGREKFNAKTPLSVRRQLLPSDNHIIVFKDNFYGLFTTLELMQLVTIEISEDARQKIGEKCRRLRRELPELMVSPRPSRLFIGRRPRL
jgi:IS4 transposase